MLGKINTLNFLKALSLNKVAKLNKLKKLKNSATLWRDFQSLSYCEVPSFHCMLIFIYPLKKRVKVKATIFI